MTATSLSTTKGFFKSLYDFKFVSLIGQRFLRFVYAVVVVLSTIGAVITILASLGQNNGVALAIAIAVIYFLDLIWLRILVEFLIVFFQMGENVHAIRAGGLDLPRVGDLAVPNVVSSDGADGTAAAAVVSTVAQTPAGQTPAGWFDAPGDPTQYRYWDGSGWTEQYSPKGGSV